MPKLAVEGLPLSLSGFTLVTVGLFLHAEFYSIFLFFSGWAILILGGIAVFYGRFHQPGRGRPNFHSLDVILIGGLIAILTLVYMNFLASPSVISACNQGSSMAVCRVASLVFFAGAITFLIGLALGVFYSRHKTLIHAP